MIGIQSIINPKASVIGPKELLKDPKAQDQISGSPLEQSLTYNTMDANEESNIGVITEPDSTTDNQPNPAAESEPSGIKTGKDALLEEDSSSKVQTKLLTPSNGIYDEETDSESDMEDVFIKRSTGRAALLSDDDDGDDDDDDKVTPYKEVQESGKKEPDIDVKLKEHSEQLFKSDLFDADSESENEQEKKKKKLKRVRATIVSDDDEDDDDEVNKKADDKRKKKSLLEEIGSDSEQGSGSDGETSSKRLVPEKDDLSDQNQDADRPDASERAKSPHKHGSRTPKPRRLKKEAIQKIHSESQRLIRESALRLPYHKPKQLTVDDFFNKRPPSARPLKPLRGLSRAATEEKKLEPMEMEKKNDAADLPDPFSSETEKTIGLPDDLSTKNINICDSLGSQTVTMATEHIAMADSIQSSSVGDDGEAKGEIGAIGSKTENESFIDEIVSSVGQKSGDLSPEGEKVQTETKVEKDPKVGDLDNIKNTEGLLETSPGDGDRCQKDSAVEGTPASSAKRQSTAMRLLQASLDKFKNITPKLSGESERVICLEEETPKTEIPAGVENLMERFARHSTKKSRGRKTQQEVQLSIVKKATNEDGKEDLKQEHISIILEPEEQEINPKLKVPGAKLLHLKETLQQRMKERRQQEREKRQMAYNIDNEEMGGGEDEEEEEEEETELSDGDMSDEEYRMGAEVDSEEDDEDFNPDDEIVREKHMFADDEAEDDDDDDEDSEGEVADDHVRKVESNSQKKMTPKPSDGNEDSGDEISPQSRKTKANSKRRILLSDDEEDEDDDGDFQETSEIMSQIKIIQQAPKETVMTPDIHQETSTLSSSSSKTSSVKKSDSSSVTHYFPDVGKTMDLFDSTSSLTDDVKNNDLTSDDKQTTFNLKEHLGRQETSTLSSSSSKTSSVKKSDSSSVTHYFPGVGKTMDLFDSTSSLTDDVKNNDLTSEDKQTTFNLKEHLGRQDSVTSKISEADNNSITSLDNSFEMFPATIPPYQPRRESLDDSDDLKSKENFTPFSKAKISLEYGSAKSTSKFPELSLPVEDSQDLFQMDTPSLMMPDSQRETETQNFRFSFDEDETQTQFLDGNGFLKLKSSAKRPGPRKIFQTENASEGNMDELLGLCSGQFNQDDARSGKVFHNENASQGNMDELLGLCSGRFSKQDDTDSPKVYKNENNTQGNMNELLGLCSGQFKEDREDKEGTPRVLQSQTSFRKGLFSQMKSQDNVSELIGLCSGNFSSQLEEDKIDKSMQKESSDKDSESSFSLVFDQETLKEELREDKQEEDGESSDDEPIILTRKKKPVTKQKEEEDESLLPYDSDDELEVNRNAFKGKTYSKFAKKKFFEQEAELSGSDADSDEDYDAEEEPDELELDREVEEQFKDTEELREQVNEIHMKATDDEDARRLRLFKELYLRDGDLHSEKSRVRRFRWKHLDEMEMDGGGGGGNGDSEDEGAEEDDQDTQWRLQRYQREQWLKEQDKETGQKEAPEEPPPVLVEDEDSQFPLSMKIVSRNNSKGSLSSSGTASNEPSEPVEKVKEKKEFNSPKPLKMHKHGSFLKRKKQELEKLASVVKPLANITRPKNNRGFIFQSLSQTNIETEKLTQPSKVKRSISVQGTSGQHLEGPQSKKPKLERSVSQTSSGSIFNHF